MPIATEPKNVSPVFGQTFEPAPTGAPFARIDQVHRGLVQDLAKDFKIEVEFRGGVRSRNGKLEPRLLNVYVLTPGADLQALRKELHLRLVAKWQRNAEELRKAEAQ